MPPRPGFSFAPRVARIDAGAATPLFAMIASSDHVPWQVLDEFVSRRVLQSGTSLMLVEFKFRQGGVGAPHSHAEHEQVGYIQRGRFEVTVGGHTRVLTAGGSYYAAPNVTHGVRALEDGVIVDAFTPLRRDLL